MADVPTFQAPTGTRDVLPPESRRWEAVIARFASQAEAAGYELALTPLFEDVGVFARGVGSGTDIVAKEMYQFEDKGGRTLALRPEVTASVVRAYVQHRPPVPWKVWYWGANFRYERPQAGRYRQFFQLGVEALGTGDPDLDVEVIALASEFYRSLGLTRVETVVNSLGDPECRPAYRERLLAFLEPRAGELCDEHRDRWRDNPLRILDCKRRACRDATADAPSQLDNLCASCAAHWDRVLAGLRALDVPVTVQPRLVRGLDYYTRTTFEFAAGALDTAQNAVGGGGRYDGLVEVLGGPATPGIGLSIGLDRLLLACDAEGAMPLPDARLDAFVVDLVDGQEARDLTAELRAAGLRADRAFAPEPGRTRSMKAQLRAADRSGARVAVIVGDVEKAAGTATVKLLRGGAVQEEVPRSDVVSWVAKLGDGGVAR